MAYVLLIEDDQQNADMVIHILQSAGLEVKHFVRGLEAAQFARKQRPLLILIDFDLPDIDGRTLVLALKKQLGSEVAPPIVALTARTGDVERRLAERFGCSGFVSKPFKPERLLSIIQTLVESSSN
jgi:CheY-like chemotaxis protein